MPRDATESDDLEAPAVICVTGLEKAVRVRDRLAKCSREYLGAMLPPISTKPPAFCTSSQKIITGEGSHNCEATC